MKNKELYLIGASFAFLGAVLYFTRKRVKNKPEQQKTNNNKNILFVGDSITDIEYKGQPTGTYPLIIRKDRPDLVVDVNAETGKTTGWMLTNLPPYLRNKKYSKVFIYGGVNDAFSDYVKLETAISNIQKMVDLSISNGAKAYVLLGYEPSGFMDYRKMPITRYVTKREDYIPLIERYKKLQGMMSSQIRNATIIPKIVMTGMTPDGTHPNSNGQKLIAESVKKHL